MVDFSEYIKQFGVANKRYNNCLIIKCFFNIFIMINLWPILLQKQIEKHGIVHVAITVHYVVYIYIYIYII